ncbi:MAG: hypothetical protein ACYS9Y_06660 [Planctomycetota bacterium]|jgi:hypothetical protein
MKNKIISTILRIMLCVAAFAFVGCQSFEQLGETEAEGRRRHIRVTRINQQALTEDIDRMLLFDQPSTLTDKSLP